MSNIKLIASDLDGTLLPEGTQDINPEFYDVVRALNDKGIIFVGASGRELETMMNVLRPVQDIIYCISNNGGRITKHGGENLLTLSLDWELVKNVVRDIREDKNCVFYSLNTLEGTYTDSKNEEVLDWLINGYGMKPLIVDDVLCKPLEVIKISVLMKSEAGEFVGPYIDKYSDGSHVTQAGEKWIDFTHIEADKGIGFKRVLDILNVKPEETWAFGDNNNDVSMIEASGTGFCAPGGKKAVEEAADVKLEGSLWDAVINQMKTLL